MHNYAEEAVKLLSRAEPAVARERRRASQDGEERDGSLPATVIEDPAELVHIINMLSKKIQQLQD